MCAQCVTSNAVPVIICISISGTLAVFSNCPNANVRAPPVGTPELSVGVNTITIAPVGETLPEIELCDVVCAGPIASCAVADPMNVVVALPGVEVTVNPFVDVVVQPPEPNWQPHVV